MSVQWTFLESWLFKRLLQQLQILDVKILIKFRGFLEFLMMYIYSLVRAFNSYLLDSPILCYFIVYIFRS